MALPHHINATLKKFERERLSAQATKSEEGIRRFHEALLESDYRPNFSIDVDRILNSLAYTRYIDKTQVFYLIQNDHITHRVLHVQLVSKIARTIGRFLMLNEDLIEAIALGHDIGHAPFGHEGEKILSDLCKLHGIGNFLHNIQSVHFLEKVERKGKGWNLCLQTLDGILCHDGEIHNQLLKPKIDKTFTTYEQEITNKKNDPKSSLMPMSLEGCVVRLADTVSYIGRDIEDAIRLNLITRDQIPRECVEILGKSIGTIVYNLVTDIIQNSFQKPYVSFSSEISDALVRLKNFNYRYIYLNPKIKAKSELIRIRFHELFESCLYDLERGDRSATIFKHFLKDMHVQYLDKHNHAEYVRDFIAGMTDQYFIRQFPAETRRQLKPVALI